MAEDAGFLDSFFLGAGAARPKSASSISVSSLQDHNESEFPTTNDMSKARTNATNNLSVVTRDSSDSQQVSIGRTCTK